MNFDCRKIYVVTILSIQVPNFPNLYRLHKLNHPRQEKTHSHGLTRQLADDVRVMWAEQQFGKLRQKRDFLPADSWLEAEQFNLPEEDRPLVRVKRQGILSFFYD